MLSGVLGKVIGFWDMEKRIEKLGREKWKAVI